MQTAKIFVTIAFLAVLCRIAWIDIRTKMIHSAPVVALLISAVLRVLLDMLENDMSLVCLYGAVIAAGVCGGIFWLLHRITKGVGLGDVKLMAAVGLYYGPAAIFSVAFLSMLMTALVGLALVIKNHGGLKRQLPFAPFVAAAAIAHEIFLLVQRL